MKQITIILLVLFTWHTKARCQDLSCTIKSARQAFSLKNDTIRILHQFSTTDGGQLLIGKANAIASIKSDGLLIKLDASANILWSKRISDTKPLESLVFNNAIESIDGNYIVGGYSVLQNGNPTFAYYLLKCDISGNILWQNEYPIDNLVGDWGNIYFTGLVEGDDKEIYISGVLNGVIPQQAATQFALILKTDIAGQLKFSKLYYENSVDLNSFIGIFPSQGHLLVWGYSEDGHNAQSDGRRIYWMRLDQNDASFQGGKAVCFSPFTQSAVSYNMSPHLFKAFKTDNGYSIAGLLAENAATKRAIVNLNFDNNLDFKRAWMLPQIPGIIASNAGDFSVSKDGNVLLAQRSNSQNMQIYLSQYDSNGILISQRQIDGFGTGTGVNTVNGGVRISKHNNDLLFSTNYLHNMVPVCEFLKVYPLINDQTCFGKQTFYGAPQNFLTYALPATQFNSIDNIAGSQSRSSITTSATVESEAICTSSIACSSVSLTGTDTVCILGQPSYYIVHRNQSCSIPVKWLFDSTNCVTANILNDSTISITWKNSAPGKQLTKLIASLDNCASVSDTMAVLLIPFLKPFQPDTSLCAGDSLRLSPGNWFKSYLWQDGSTDSFLVARKPGLYTVTYQTFCGRTITDSVHINPVNGTLLLDDSENICKGDSAVLQANAGFSNYQWTPDYYKQSIAENTIRIFPLIDTTYIVTAILNTGCRIYDSIKIKVYNRADIKIIKELQECQEAVLSAQSTAQLSEFLWSGPSQRVTETKIKASQSGLYKLSVKDMNGCHISDSINLVLEPCSNQISFPNAFTPNGDGRNDVFRPVVKGYLSEYEMNVYSSWGQRVFFSHIPSEGWDGKVTGQPQQNASFVWVCKYRFQGQKAIIKKGAVILIR